MESPPRPKRGLSALLASTIQPVIANHTQSNDNAVVALDIPLKSIRANTAQPRTHFDEDALNELAASIKARGLIQPVVARELRPDEIAGEHRYELIAGERRWRASERAGLSSIPVVVKKVFEPRDILLLSLVENLQRDDLNPIEEAQAYERLAKTFNLTHDQIAEGVGKSRATVSNSVRILSLPSSIQDALRTRSLSIGHAKVLLAIPDSRIQAQLAAKAQAENLTVKELERLVAGAPVAVASLPQKASDHSRSVKVAPVHLQEAERRLREYFGTRVQVEEGLRKGRISIDFYSVEDFARIIKLMGIE